MVVSPVVMMVTPDVVMVRPEMVVVAPATMMVTPAMVVVMPAMVMVVLGLLDEALPILRQGCGPGIRHRLRGPRQHRELKDRGVVKGLPARRVPPVTWTSI